MKRLIVIPQFPIKLRYQEWWIPEILKNMSQFFKEVIVLGSGIVKLIEQQRDRDPQSFTVVTKALQFETFLMTEFIQMEITDDDVVFLTDLSFPGFFSDVFFHKKVKNIYAYCHATSINKYDYFQDVRKNKWKIENIHGEFYKKVFVGSQYHMNKLIKHGWKAKNLCVLKPPLPPFKTQELKKEYDIISVARPTKQKITKGIEDRVEKKFGKIKRSVDFVDQNKGTWNEYCKFISKSKVMLISAKEETFGYQVLDAFLNNCIPIAPHNCSYPELITPEFLYRNTNECLNIIKYSIDNFENIYKFVCQNNSTILECSQYYKKLATIIRTDCFNRQENQGNSCHAV